MLPEPAFPPMKVVHPASCDPLWISRTGKLSRAYSHTNYSFEYTILKKIIHEKEFFVFRNESLSNLEYLKAQILKISPLAASHGGALVGSMCKRVCPKKLCIPHCFLSKLYWSQFSYHSTVLREYCLFRCL